MVYTISDKIIDELDMTHKFKRVNTNETEQKQFGLDEKWRIWRNMLVLGFAFMIHFTAFWGASNLQSSVNADEALGTSTLAAIYGSLLLSNIFLPTMVIKLFGCKWTMAISFLLYIPFIASQFYARFYTMIPSGLLVGFGGGPLWCAKCTFLSVISETYSEITGIASSVVVTRFFGVFYMFYQLSQVWGNLISSAVLSTGSPADLPLTINSTAHSFVNETFLTVAKTRSDDTRDVCGASFCPGTASQNIPNLEPPPIHKIQYITGIYLACMVVACLIIAFGVDSLKRYGKTRKGSAHGLSGLKLLAVTLKHTIIPYQLLIIPITMFIGAEQAFLVADYTASFVSCSWGISNIGFVMICFGVTNAIAAILLGGIVKKIGRNPIMAFGFVLHQAICIVLLVWKPHSINKPIFFVIAGLWGVCDAIWLVQINSLSGILFPGKEEAAFSNFRLWESTGSVITYAYSPYLCTNIKIYILMGLLFIGICGYTTVEVMEYKNKKDNVDAIRGKFQLVNGNNKESEIPN